MLLKQITMKWIPPAEQLLILIPAAVCLLFISGVGALENVIDVRENNNYDIGSSSASNYEDNFCPNDNAICGVHFTVIPISQSSKFDIAFILN